MADASEDRAAEHMKAALSELQPCRHAPDFRSVLWYGTAYTFTALQAAVVRALWEAWENGTPEIGGETLMDLAGASRDEPRLDQVFRNNPAWGAMIVSGSSKGAYRLQSPDTGK